MGSEIRIYKIETIVKKLLLLTSVLAWISGVSAEEKPKLIVGVVISHFYPEWMDMYGNELSENGLKRVMKQGARVNVNYNYFYTQTGVDHASIYTGMLPTEHGDRVEGVVRSFTPETSVFYSIRSLYGNR